MTTTEAPQPISAHAPHTASQPPGAVTPRAVARVLMGVRRNPLDALDAMARRHGSTFWIRIPGATGQLFAGTPEAIQHVLVSNQDNYGKTSQYELLKRALGLGLVTSDGELWRSHRRLIQPKFAKRALVPFGSLMARAAADAMDDWDRAWGARQLVDASDITSALALDVVGRALVGADFGGSASSEIAESLDTMLGAVGSMARNPLTQLAANRSDASVRAAMRMLPRRHRTMHRSVDELDAALDRIIQSRRRAEGTREDDLLQLLVSHRDPETGAPLTETEIRDELMTFTLAGHETTANALSWLLALLSQHPDHRARLLEEVDAVLGGAQPTGEDAQRLPWTAACFQEAMRLYPPVWMVQRLALGPDVVDGQDVPAGTTVAICPWLIHRDPQLWENPLAFDPNRFMGDAAKDRHRMAYVPFAAGRRSCIGQGFAMLEGILLTATISQRYVFDLAPTARLQPQPDVTLRPMHGMPMIARRR